MVFGSRRAPLATWLGKTRLTSGGAGIGARGRGQDEREEGRKEGRQECRVAPLLKSRDSGNYIMDV